MKAGGTLGKLFDSIFHNEAADSVCYPYDSTHNPVSVSFTRTGGQDIHRFTEDEHHLHNQKKQGWRYALTVPPKELHHNNEDKDRSNIDTSPEVLFQDAVKRRGNDHAFLVNNKNSRLTSRTFSPSLCPFKYSSVDGGEGKKLNNISVGVLENIQENQQSMLEQMKVSEHAVYDVKHAIENLVTQVSTTQTATLTKLKETREGIEEHLDNKIKSVEEGLSKLDSKVTDGLKGQSDIKTSLGNLDNTLKGQTERIDAVKASVNNASTKAQSSIKEYAEENNKNADARVDASKKSITEAITTSHDNLLKEIKSLDKGRITEDTALLLGKVDGIQTKMSQQGNTLSAITSTQEKIETKTQELERKMDAIAGQIERRQRDGV